MTYNAFMHKIDFSNEFPAERRRLHLNHAGLAPWPKRTMALVQAFAEDCCQGCFSRWPEWEACIQRARQALARLLAVKPEEIAFVKNTSEAVSTIAYGLDWPPGSNVVVGRREFPANRLPWDSLQRSLGIEIHWVDYQQEQSIEEALLSRVDRHTRLLAVSSIHYEDGYRVDLQKLGEACRQDGVLFCVDAIQSLGAVPFDVRRYHVDFVCSGSHKWLMAPEGVGILYGRPDLTANMKLNQYGWHMTSTPNDYSNLNWRPADHAGRFECGSMNTMGLCALSASLSLILELGIDKLARLLSNNVDYLIRGIDPESYEILTPSNPRQRGGILSFRHRRGDNRKLYKHLREQGVLCAPRAGGVRFSPHFYNSQKELDQALSCLERWA